MRQLLSVNLFIIVFLLAFSASAQNSDVWTLERSVQYALDHNLSIQQNVLNERLARLTLMQSQLSQLPNANMNGQYGKNYGRSVDPTTNQFIQSDYSFAGISGNADVLLFGWFMVRNTVSQNKFNLQAAQADLDQLRDDISLNVATGYLRAILAREQIVISEKQVELSKAQLDQTRRFVEAGRLPELNAAQLEAQLSGDSANLIQAMTDYTAAILDMRALLNLDFVTPFEVQAPDVKVGDMLTLASMTPEQVYEEAARNLGTIRSSKLKLAASEKGLAATRGALYPQLSVGAQLGTNYASSLMEVTGFTVTGMSPTGTFVPIRVGGVDTVLNVYQPDGDVTTRRIPFTTQLDNNFRQSVYVNLNVPLFNGWQNRYNVKRSQLSVMTEQLNVRQAELNLKQNVYKAYNDARNSIQKYYAAQRSADAAQRAFGFAEKRYELGLTNTVEYLTTQNTLYSAESRLNSAKYDLIFKLKVIDYYLGRELKL